MDSNWWKGAQTAAELEVLYVAGSSHAEMAAAFGVTQGAIRHRLHECGLIAKHGRSRDTGDRKEVVVMAKVPATAKPGWPKNKKCLRCRCEFRSEGPHNHVCPPCQRSNGMAVDTRVAW